MASDFHGKNPSGLVKSLVRNEGIGRAVFLGDYDEPRILEEILELDIDKIVLVGNHDYNLAHGMELYSPNLNKTLEEYWNLWGDTFSGRFIRESARIEKGIKRGMKVIRRHNNEKIVYLHGSLCDPYGYGKEEVWGRVLTDDLGFRRERRVICNFREMKKEDYWAMFRGHDHFPVVFSTNRKNYSEKFQEVKSSIYSTQLSKEDMHLVSLGAFVEGEYALFDDDTGRLEFRLS